MKSLTTQHGILLASNEFGSLTIAHTPQGLPSGGDISASLSDQGVFTGTWTYIDNTRNLTASEQAVVMGLWDDLTALQGPIKLWAVDEEGVPLGAVDTLPPGAIQVPSEAPSPQHRWTGAAWKLPVNLPALKVQAKEDVDRAAGAARARYLTLVPGQEAAYAAKEAEARAFLNDPELAVPPYVQAEADATGVTPYEAANNIVAAADAWALVKGPNIERIRRSGSVAIEAATSETPIYLARNNAVLELDNA